MPRSRKRLGQPVDAIPLGDAVQVERERRRLSDKAGRRVDLERMVGGRPVGRHRGADPVGCRCVRPEAPGRHRVAHADVEGSVRGAPDLEPEPQYLPQPIRHRHPRAHGRRVEAHEVAVGLPGGHLGVHLVDGGLQCRAGRRRVEACAAKNSADQRVPMVGPFRAWRTSSVDIFDIPPLRLQHRGREPSGCEHFGHRVGDAAQPCRARRRP